MATFRGKVSTTCRDALDKMYAHLGVKLGRVIKEAHQGEANATRRIFSMGFSDTLAPMTGAFTTTHMVTPTLTLGKCVLASAASIGRAKYGKEKMARMSSKGKKRGK